MTCLYIFCVCSVERGLNYISSCNPISCRTLNLLHSDRRCYSMCAHNFPISASQHHLLDLVQVVGPSVINIMEEACCYHGHYLQVGVVPLQHSRLSTQRRTQSGQKQSSFTVFLGFQSWKQNITKCFQAFKQPLLKKKEKRVIPLRV